MFSLALGSPSNIQPGLGMLLVSFYRFATGKAADGRLPAIIHLRSRKLPH